MENKMLDLKIEDGKLVISVDPNKDGQPVVYVKVDLKEVPDEIIDLLKK